MVEFIIIGGHAVNRGNGAQGANEIIGAGVAHDAHGLNRQKHREGLPDSVVETGGSEFLNEDHVGAAQHVELIWVTSPGTRMASPGPGKGWRPTILVDRPNSRPGTRTSCLNSSRSGSTSARFMRSGRPPTLWWDLMVTDGPPEKETGSMTSG